MRILKTYSLFLFFGITLSMVLNFLLMSKFHNLSPIALFNERRSGYQEKAKIDLFASIYMQTSQDSCGAAAISYLLTKIGDTVLEAHAIERLPPPSDIGYSLADLAKYAEQRGFVALSLRGGLRSLPNEGEAPVIAHLKMGHYVVVLLRENNQTTMFDPALGKNITVSDTVFLDAWSGKLLRVMPNISFSI